MSRVRVGIGGVFLFLFSEEQLMDGYQMDACLKPTLYLYRYQPLDAQCLLISKLSL